MATPQQDQCPTQDRNIELLQQIEGLTAQLKNNLVKAKEERKKAECTSQGGDNGEGMHFKITNQTSNNGGSTY
jgi:hypothetical protein